MRMSSGVSIGEAGLANDDYGFWICDWIGSGSESDG